MKEDFDRIHTKLDSLDGKVDALIRNEAKNTESIKWLKGHVNTVTAVVVAVVAWFFKKMFNE